MVSNHAMESQITAKQLTSVHYQSTAAQQNEIFYIDMYKTSHHPNNRRHDQLQPAKSFFQQQQGLKPMDIIAQ